MNTIVKSALFGASLFAVAASGTGLALAQDGEAPTIVVVTHGQANDPFWSVVKNGVEQAAKNTGANVSYRAPETFDMVAMSQLIDAAVNQEPDGLAVSVPDADALRQSIERAVAAGIPVITLNAGADVSKDLGALLHVGQSEYEAGRRAGERLAELGGTNGICVNQEVGNVSLDQRCEGFAEGFGNTTEVLPTTNDPADVEAKVRAALQSNGEIDTILALGAATAGEPSVAAVESLNRLDDVNIASFDLSANFLQAVADGKADFAIDQQQFLQGYLPVSFLNLDARYGLMPAGDVPSGPNFVTQDNAQQVIELSSQGIR
ncbi:sugar ABC transporter substrate-binding protein [Fulvimarina endophytica]|uniref:Sugar ABC transporter substrate-binding protein n=1 Tax=Fulvimarina endophytica TaxID=2293836 RepID=A0A371X2M8_9HYPH|nr:sugar ABC transporter substrate-binding protein [Fulvimarina endophytica]RFC63480.1 sugar ABC transporter substrate-binding protein [Fulvimarina endophytica]